MGNIMSYGTGAMDVVQSSTTGTPTQFQDGSGTQIGTLCRAWVTFAGSSGTKSASFNVSSVTRVSTGNYTVNFANSFSDANYSVQAQSIGWWTIVASASTTSCAVQTIQGSGFANYDSTTVFVAIFR